MAQRGRPPKGVSAAPTQLDIQAGEHPNPDQLVENRPEERPFNDRSEVEANYVKYMEEAAKEPQDWLQKAELPEQQVEEAEPQGEEQTIQVQQSAQSEEGEVKAGERTESQPQPPQTPAQEGQREPLVPEAKPSVRFKDLQEAEAEVTKTEERYKNAEKKMHEATQEAAELKRQMKYLIDTLQSGQKQGETPPSTVQEKKKSVLEMGDDELSTAILEKPREILAQLRQEAKEEAVKEALSVVEERTKESVTKQTAITFKDRIEASDKYFEEKYPDMKRHEKLIGILATHSLATPEGRKVIMRNPHEYVDNIVRAARDLLQTDQSQAQGGNGQTPPPQPPPAQPEPQAQQVVQGERREKLVAAPVVKPTPGFTPPKPEEKVMSPQEYVDMRRKIQDRAFLGRDYIGG